ncbi:hypothetical protein ScalyP_jg5386 [Parmales sp. scaly parma]|nr:hypothetical protein ScalyP_jg5386 [Parmales sp. scaly parma]
MVLANKSLASSYETNSNFFLVLFQSLVAILCCEISKRCGWVKYPHFDIDTAIQWAPVNVLFCGMLFTGMGSLQHNSVPMVTVFKNVANIFTAIGDNIFFGNPVEPLVRASFAVMMCGAVAATYNDSSITTNGLIWMLMNCITTSGYCLYMKYATKTIKLSKFGMVYYNNVLATFLLAPVVLLNGEIREFFIRTDLHNASYALHNIFAGFVGFFLNFASLSCVAATGPTTYIIIGSLNKIPTAFLGVFIFRTELSKETWFFVSISMVGGFLYSWAKLKGVPPAKLPAITPSSSNV